MIQTILVALVLTHLQFFLKTGDVVGGSYLLPWIYIIMEWWIIVITSCSKNLKNQNPLKVRDKSGSNDFVCSVIFFFLVL